MSDAAYEYRDFGLKNLLKAFKGNLPVGKIGILGDKDARSKGSSNATIGLKHEYGIGVDRRSWLRMPLIDHLQEYLDKNGAFDKDALAKVIKEGSIKNWVEKFCITGVEVIHDAFNTGGFGQWKPSNMALKKVHQTLVETGQLRDAVSWEVTE